MSGTRHALHPAAVSDSSEHEDEEQDDEQTMRRHQCDYKETIRVFVGSSEDAFVPHKATACAKSHFFQAACSQRSQGEEENTVHLQDAGQDIFHVFEHCMYTGTLNLDHISLAPDWLTPSETWAMGNYLQCVDLRNAVINRMFRKVPGTPPAPIVLQRMWEVTPAGSKVRDLVIDIMLACVSKEDFEINGSFWPVEVLVAFAKAYYEPAAKRKAWPEFEERCLYHAHEENGPMCI